MINGRKVRAAILILVMAFAWTHAVQFNAAEPDAALLNAAEPDAVQPDAAQLDAALLNAALLNAAEPDAAGQVCGEKSYASCPTAGRIVMTGNGAKGQETSI